MTSSMRTKVELGRAVSDEGQTVQRLVSTRIFLRRFLHRTDEASLLVAVAVSFCYYSYITTTTAAIESFGLKILINRSTALLVGAPLHSFVCNQFGSNQSVFH
jgi:hypothetical protein